MPKILNLPLSPLPALIFGVDDPPPDAGGVDLDEPPPVFTTVTLLLEDGGAGVETFGGVGAIFADAAFTAGSFNASL